MAVPVQTTKVQRLRELDFLRGVAIVLVLFRHGKILHPLITAGWAGVDLFFVLSGFLVSGLLFREYKKFGNIKPGRFLIRRGFKIYPIYYLFYIPYILWIIYAHQKLIPYGIFCDLTFIQNYTWPFSYAYPASWSLAVEEHFYFFFTFCMFWVLSKNHLKTGADDGKITSHKFEITLLLIFVLCLLMRFASNLIWDNWIYNVQMTHLRIDSLLAGVLISYMYYFSYDFLKEKFEKYKTWLYPIAVLGICWTPFIDPEYSFWVRTVGFTLVYISCGILLLNFILGKNINQTLDKYLSRPLVTLFSKIGYCSYSIYIIHTLVIHVVNEIQIRGHISRNRFLTFFLESTASILCGMLMTYFIERYFLDLRDKHFPNRALAVPEKLA
jgi:peptidoglycan/LPS O-acetylase OafA/YrhL